LCMFSKVEQEGRVQVRWQALRGAVVRLLVSLPESLCPSRLLEPKTITL